MTFSNTLYQRHLRTLALFLRNLVQLSKDSHDHHAPKVQGNGLSRRMVNTLTVIALATPLYCAQSFASDNARVAMHTEYGIIEIEVFEKLAPKTAANFLKLVDEGFYNGLVFHRVIANFMIQGGGFDADLNYKDEDISIPNESFNGVKNTKGTIAMARTNDPDSAGTQFFINVRDNPYLDAQGSQAGYAVFGRVVSGMDTVEKIELVNTHLKKGMAAVPEEAVVMTLVERVGD